VSITLGAGQGTTLLGGTSTDIVGTRRSVLAAAAAGLRPKQWIKNGLVFAAPVGAGVELHWLVVAQAIGCFFALSLVASATYLVNDLRDVEADRLHPKKCRRPIAAGELSTVLAKQLCVVTATAGLVLGYAVGGVRTDLVLVAYVALSSTYTYALKHTALLDVLAVALCFVIRVIAGAVGTGTTLPHGMLACTAFGALFMVVGKRYAEYRSLGNDRSGHRKVLGKYSEVDLRALFYFSITATALGYCWWVFERARQMTPAAICFEASILPAVLLLTQYGLLVEEGAGGSPEELVLHDRRLQILGALAGVLFLIGGLHTV
jgi:decaprenyl-phosphate phosphoribosyltransferase